MKLYKTFERFVCNLGDNLIALKMFYSEWHSIFQKRHLYNDLLWDSEQKKEFDLFFSTHLGHTISPRWHKLYQSMNGTFCVQYFPEILYTTKLEKMWNPIQYSHVLCDKSLLRILFSNNLSGMRTPIEFVTCCNGVYRDVDCQLIKESKVLDILWNIGRVCIKPTTETGSGKGVQFPVFENGKDSRNGRSVRDILNEYGKNYTVQECIKEHSSFSQLHPTSLNTIRVITYHLEGQVFHTPLAARIGSGKSELDNIHAGGLSVGVSDEGQLCTEAFRLGYGNKNEHFTEHPDTNIVFARHKLDGIPKVLKAAALAHARIPQLGIVSWDFVVDLQGVPVLIEANLEGQSIWFPQIVNGKSAFGENTGKILEMIREYKNK